MDKSLFEKAKIFGMAHFREWLPQGHDVGNEFKCINPTRDDHREGSFSVNTVTGLFSDFATGDKGDVIALYAYLFSGELQSAASKYNNPQAGLQVEACKAILLKYDSSYFPTKDDDFTPPKEKVNPKNKWAGYSYCNYAIKELPDFHPEYYQKTFGEYKEKWDFYYKNRLVFMVCRFVKPSPKGKDKKNDIPFTVWKKSDSEAKWRAKNIQDELFPLWNINSVLEDKENLPVIITEGQKAASRGTDPRFLYVGFYGGCNSINKTDWSTLAGRKCYYWADADTAGRMAIKKIREIAKENDINLQLIDVPTNVKMGYDLADYVEEGKDIKELVDKSTDKDDNGNFLDDDSTYPFKILGVRGNEIYFYVKESYTITHCKNSQINKGFLLTIAPLTFWGDMFTGENNKTDWDVAINFVIQKANLLPVFDLNKERGVGTWREGEEVVINTGEYLLIDGKKEKLSSRLSPYVYIKGNFIPYTYKEPLTIKETVVVRDWLKSISWTNRVSPYVILGWVTLAPFGGLLRWRSNIWCCGPSGSGKSTIIEKFIHPMVLNEFGIRGDGPSSIAGVRQSLTNTSKPFVGDEMESDNPKSAENINNILQLFRSSSSGQNGAAILQGTADGESKRLVIQSMAMFASIGASIKHGADANRFTICELKRSDDDNEKRQREFMEIEKVARNFTNEFARRYHARTYIMIKKVLAGVDVFRAETANIMGSMRDGDQLGTLLGGAYMAVHDEVPTNEEAKKWLEDLDVKNECKNENLTDEEALLSAILSANIEVTLGTYRERLNISEIIEEYIKQKFDNILPEAGDERPALTVRSMNRALGRVGVRVNNDGQGNIFLLVATNYAPMQKILMATPWQLIYSDMLKRIKGAAMGANSTTFAGKSSRYISIPYRKIGPQIEEEEIYV